jgi:hypothetical protein
MSSREAAVLPGGANGPHAPLLMYAADAAVDNVVWPAG